VNAPLKKLSELTGVVFDGRRSGYVPPKTLSISPKLKLHRKAKKGLDPVTFEVVRHALWNVNEEHGATIQRLSGSPVAMYALDLNPSTLSPSKWCGTRCGTSTRSTAPPSSGCRARRWRCTRSTSIPRS